MGTIHHQKVRLMLNWERKNGGRKKSIKQRVLELINQNDGGYNFNEVAIKLDINSTTARISLNRLAKENKIKREIQRISKLYNNEVIEVGHSQLSKNHVLSPALPVEYNPKAECSDFKMFLIEIAQPKHIQLIKEKFGFSLHKGYEIRYPMNGLIFDRLVKFYCMVSTECQLVPIFGTLPWEGSNV